MSLFAELKRRKVFKVAGAYLVVAWLAVQAASILLPTFGAPLWALRVFVLVTFLGFPLALLLAWIFDVTPEGVKVDTRARGGKVVYAVVGLLTLLAVGWYYKGQPSYRAGDVPAVTETSVAVLPFANMSGKADEEYFSDGMTEELLNVLAKIPKLKVAARTSVFEFKGKGGDAREIGRKLGVTHLVEGSIRRDGEQVRVTAQLIRVADGFHLWSENYDRELKGVFALQDDIARQIAGQLQLKLGVESMPEARVAVDPVAYDEYLKGRALYRQRKSLPEAIAHFNAAVARAPGFAPGWSSLSLTYEVVAGYTTAAELAALGDVYGKILSTAERAIALEPGTAMTLHVQANLARSRFRYAEAERLYADAIKADPTYPDGREDYAQLLLLVGRPDDALAQARQLATLEPYVANFWNILMEIGFVMDRRDLVDEGAARILAIDPRFRYADTAEYRFHLFNGRIEQARTALRGIMARIPERAAEDALLFAWATGEAGADDAAARRLVLDYRYKHDTVYAVIRGEHELALSAFLDMVKPAHTRYWFYQEASYLACRPLLADPRAKPLLRDYGFEAYWRERGWPPHCRPLGDDDFECGTPAGQKQP